jgi:mRNA interferase MazF
MIARGDIWWAELQAHTGSGPGKRRPVLMVSADSFNLSRIGTVVAVAISSNVDLEAAPGNVAVPAERSGIAKDSVVNVSQIDTGLRLVLDLIANEVDTEVSDLWDGFPRCPAVGLGCTRAARRRWRGHHRIR